MPDISEEQLTDNQTAESVEPIQKKSFFKRCRHCEDLKKESEEFKAGWQRALADYRNLQAEIARQKSDWAKLSEWQILLELIPVYENFKKAFVATNDGGNNWAKGIECIMRQLGDVLKSHGVEEIKTVGEKFDPRWHETVGQEEVANGERDLILREVGGGYKLGDKVLQVARVIVSKSDD